VIYREYDTEEELLQDVLLGVEDAVQFCNLFARACQFADDVRDGDTDRYTGREIEEEVFVSWFVLDNDPFYIRFRTELQPIYKAAYLAWTTANEFERSGNERLQAIAYVLRDLNVMLVVQCAMIVGGVSHAMSVAPTIWWNCFKDETFEEYRSEFSRPKTRSDSLG